MDKPIIIKIEGTVKNSNINCYYKNDENKDLEYKSLEFNFEWSFNMIPDGGYKFNGIFPLKIINTNCKKIN